MMTETLIQKNLNADMTVTEGAREFVAVMTSNVVDRDNEVLMPEGMDSTDFMKNPILYLNHDYNRLPIGKVVGLGRIRNERNETTGWLAKGQTAARPESHPEAAVWEPDVVLALMQQDIIKGVSVGLMPKEPPRMATAKDKEMFGPEVKTVIPKWKLLELSVAPLPANQTALIQMVSKGLATVEGIKAVTGITIEVPVVAAKVAEPVAPKRTVEVGRPGPRVTIEVVDYHAERMRKAVKRAAGRAVGMQMARRTGRLWV